MVNCPYQLVGGLEHRLFSHILGIIIPIHVHIFQRGRLNHQPVKHVLGKLMVLIMSCPDMNDLRECFSKSSSKIKTSLGGRGKHPDDPTASNCPIYKRIDMDRFSCGNHSFMIFPAFSHENPSNFLGFDGSSG